MKAKTKLQKRVLELHKKLPKLTQAQSKWIENDLFDHYVYRTKSKLCCFECGHEWPGNGFALINTIDCTCPNCGTKLSVRQDKKRKLHDVEYTAIVTTSQEFQVIRYFIAWQNCRLNQQAKYDYAEVVQHWITSKCSVTIMALKVQGLSPYYDSWIYGSEIGFPCNPDHERYRINPGKVYPRYKVIDVIKRNGFKGDFHNVNPRTFITRILTEPKAETLLKANQISLFQNLYHYPTESLWPSIKICIRNKYIVKDATIWSDYIQMLKRDHKDTLNPKYVCPQNLREEHDKLQAKLRRLREIEDRKRELEKLRKDQDELNRKKAFFDLQITDGEIKIVVLDSIEEFKQEGDILNHCVYTNAYHGKPDSLIMSARKDDQRLETIEVSLSSMKVVQSRGLRNTNTEYHDRIVQLVNKNINLIKKRKHAKLQQAS